MLFRFDDQARLELIEIARRYEAVRAGLGNQFLAEAYELIATSLEFPFAAPEIRDGVRKKRFQHFPYSLIYEAEQGSLVIYAVSHHKRDPAYWQQRLNH